MLLVNSSYQGKLSTFTCHHPHTCCISGTNKKKLGTDTLMTQPTSASHEDEDEASERNFKVSVNKNLACYLALRARLRARF